jgi:hypothetical protein
MGVASTVDRKKSTTDTYVLILPLLVVCHHVSHATCVDLDTIFARNRATLKIPICRKLLKM